MPSGWRTFSLKKVHSGDSDEVASQREDPQSKGITAVLSAAELQNDKHVKSDRRRVQSVEVAA